jgi:hypothetical protein
VYVLEGYAFGLWKEEDLVEHYMSGGLWCKKAEVRTVQKIMTMEKLPKRRKVP